MKIAVIVWQLHFLPQQNVTLYACSLVCTSKGKMASPTKDCIFHRVELLLSTLAWWCSLVPVTCHDQLWRCIYDIFHHCHTRKYIFWKIGLILQYGKYYRITDTNTILVNFVKPHWSMCDQILGNDPNRTSVKTKQTPPMDSYTTTLLVQTLSITQTTEGWF